LPAFDGLFLGEDITPRRWDGSKLINISGSQIPDVLLLNGSRAMTGDLTLGSYGINFSNTRTRELNLGGGVYAVTFRNLADTAYAYLQCLGVKIWEFDWQGINNYFRASTGKVFYTGGDPPLVLATQDGTNAKWILDRCGEIHMLANERIYWDSYPGGYKDYIDYDYINDLFRFYIGLNLIFSLDSAGIVMPDDKFIKVGKDSDGILPTADSSYRGKMIRVEGGAGVADKLYMCMKSAADTYSWVQIASG